MNESITIQENNLMDSYLFYYLINLSGSTGVTQVLFFGMAGTLGAFEILTGESFP